MHCDEQVRHSIKHRHSQSFSVPQNAEWDENQINEWLCRLQRLSKSDAGQRNWLI